MLDLNASAWMRVYKTTLNARPIPGQQGKFQPIPDLRVPIALNSHSLLVGANSLKLKPRWKLGFWLNMRIGKISGIGEPACPDIPIPLGLLYVKLPKLSANYNVIAKIPHWHQQMTVEIWQYKGIEPTSLESLGEQLKQVNQNFENSQAISTQTIFPGQLPGIY